MKQHKIIAIAIAVALLFTGAMAIPATPIMALEDKECEVENPPAECDPNYQEDQQGDGKQNQNGNGNDDPEPISDEVADNGNNDSDAPSNDAPVIGFATINPDENNIAPELIDEVMDILEGLIIGPAS